jgi:hypothetical protein
LLKRSASGAGTSARDVKKQWLALTRKQRAAERRRLQAEQG